MSIFGIFGKMIDGKDIADAENKYPIAELAEHIGHVIEVHYLNGGAPTIERGILIYPPDERGFYVGDPNWFHRIDWDSTIMRIEKIIEGEQKKYVRSPARCAVRLITDENGIEIYRNDAIPFDGPILRSTR